VRHGGGRIPAVVQKEKGKRGTCGKWGWATKEKGGKKTVGSFGEKGPRRKRDRETKGVKQTIRARPSWVGQQSLVQKNGPRPCRPNPNGKETPGEASPA